VKREHEIRFPDKFWRRSTHLSFAAKGLYAVLATFADYRTGETFVSNARLQLETGYGICKIKILLKELKTGGFIGRDQELRRNLKSKRHIWCLKYVVSVVRKSSDRPGGMVFWHDRKRCHYPYPSKVIRHPKRTRRFVFSPPRPETGKDHVTDDFD